MTTRIKKYSILVVCVIFVLGSQFSMAYGQEADSLEIKNITSRLKGLLTTTLPDSSEVMNVIRTMNSDGSWSGIDYQSTDVLVWTPIQHLSYIHRMAQSYSSQRSQLYQSDSVKTAIHQSLNFWLSHNFTSRNWWVNDIGVPNVLSNILILMGGEITQNELLQALNQMRGSYIHQEGQNLVWRAGIQLKIGLIEYGRGHVNLLGTATDRIRSASKILQDQIIITDAEGIQPDWSFHQHGTQLQFGNYGQTFARSQVEWAWALGGTSFKYPADKIEILRNYIIKGLSTAVWKEVMDLSGAGRSLAVNAPENMGKEQISILQLMEKVDASNIDLYSNTIACLKDSSSNCTVMPQNTFFWRSDFMVHRTHHYYASVRTHSRFIQSTESGIGQNISGAYLADGATYLYQSGKEYYNILPIWDWRRIPGITSYTQEQLPSFGWSGLPNESDFVGGVSDTFFGVSAMLFKRDGLSAHKAWFFGPNGIVCLGAGINSNKKSTVSTTINQCFLSGKIVAGINKSKEIVTEKRPLNRSGINWIYHDNTGYVFLQNNKVYVSNDIQKGNWKQVYKGGKDDLITGNVFNLGIDHGSRPQNDSYAYAIYPGIDMDSTGHYAAHPIQKVLRNDTLIQAVQYEKNKMLQAVFYRPGKIAIDESTILETDSPCILMTRQESKNFILTVSSPPEQGKMLTLNQDGHPEAKDLISDLPKKQPKRLTITLNGHFDGDYCVYDSTKNKTDIQIQLPNGMYEGKSIKIVIRKNKNI